MKQNIAITASHVSKRYKIGTQKDGSLRGTLTGVIGSKSVKSQEEFWALNNVSFEIKKGEVIGIVGKNGAGKSTLLKILSQITKPTSGRIEINGRVASLLEVGTGFHPELTGRENIYLNGTILGMSRQEVKDKFDEIVEFSGVEKFIDTPVKNYSSGMYVRLAFAVAAHLEPEILIIDEVLAVGDAEFQEKCLGKMKDVSSQGRTVIFVSHNISSIKSLCSSAIFIEQGRLIKQAGTSEIINDYMSKKSKKTTSYVAPTNKYISFEPSFKSIRVVDFLLNECSDFTINDDIFIQFEFNFTSINKKFSVFAIIKDQFGEPVFSAERTIDQNKLTLKIDKDFLVRGCYFLHTFIHIPAVFQLEAIEETCNFNVIDLSSSFTVHGDYHYGRVFGRYNWLIG
jgi:lipopolysaccharide transport system ATP-binding protein